jgi:hypothetical protein
MKDWQCRGFVQARNTQEIFAGELLESCWKTEDWKEVYREICRLQGVNWIELAYHRAP